MAWDASRPVPWERLIKEWLLYAGVMAALFLLLFRNSNIVGAIIGILVSGPLYLLFGAVLAKFGYTRKTMKELRRGDDKSSDKSSKSSSSTDDSSSQRGAPSPTKRTSTGYNRPTAKQKRR
jgi:hypothetical protein